MHRSIVVTPNSSPRLRWARIRFSDGMATTCWPLRCPPSTTPCLPGPLLSYPSPQASVRLIPPGWTKIYKVPLVRCGSTAIKELDVSSLLGPSINQACFTTPRQEPPRKSTKATYYLGISSLILLLVLACWSSDCLYVRTTASSSEVGAETDIMIHRLPYRPPPHLHCTDMIRLSRQFTSRAVSEHLLFVRIVYAMYMKVSNMLCDVWTMDVCYEHCIFRAPAKRRQWSLQ
ncbi:hypothetical protein BD413DRAFT_240829 [Trametes elegans]|nr:hypothetical protein BD413DRAFT_240829 [Trametes elegans]